MRALKISDAGHTPCSQLTEPHEHLVTALCLRRNKLSLGIHPSAPHISAKSQLVQLTHATMGNPSTVRVQNVTCNPLSELTAVPAMDTFS